MVKLQEQEMKGSYKFNGTPVMTRGFSEKFGIFRKNASCNSDRNRGGKSEDIHIFYQFCQAYGKIQASGKRKPCRTGSKTLLKIYRFNYR